MFLAGMLLAWCPRALALDPALDVSQYAHTAWRIRDGFSKGAIYCIAQTPDGYLWLGTEFGLLRFDGVRTVPWQPPADQHLPSSRITSLLAARDGTLWIGTSRGVVVVSVTLATVDDSRGVTPGSAKSSFGQDWGDAKRQGNREAVGHGGVEVGLGRRGCVFVIHKNGRW